MPNTPALRLLSRVDCHLCEIAQRDLDLLGVNYKVVDIDEDPELEQLYGEAIPVLMNGKTELARAPMTRDGLKRALAGLKSPETAP